MDTEIRDITLALDSLIESDAFSRTGTTMISEESYKKVLERLSIPISDVVRDLGLPAPLAARIEERLRGANDIAHAARQRTFFERVGFSPGAREREALKERHPMSHRGYLWRDGDDAELLEGFSEEVRIARSFVNNVILALLGYEGPVLDYLYNANVQPGQLRR